MTKIYGNKDSFRTQKALIAAKLAGKDAVVAGSNAPANKFSTHVLPALEDGNTALAGEDAIASHFLGKDFSAQVLQWVSYGNYRLQPDVLAYVLPSVSAAKVDNSSLENARKELFAKLKEFDEVVKHVTYLVGERLSYADVSVALDLLPAFRHVLSEKERSQFVNVTRWFLTVLHQSPVKAVLGDVPLASQVAKFDEGTFKKLSTSAPKKEEKKEQPKKEEKPKKTEEPEDDAPAAEKFVDPLQSLPPGSFVMDSWKRVYSNEDTATKAIPYFWENFDSENYSIWYGEYKYPEDLTLTFMSCNLITGMFQRLDKMRKHAFGSVILFGTDNNSTISGVWIWRGQDLAFSLCPDWQVDYESYAWKKLDPKDEQTKKTVNEYWLWEGDFGGKKFNQGKIFKMKTRLCFLSCFFGLAVAQLCSNSEETKQVFGSYLNCLKRQIDNDYVELEGEIRTDNRKAAAACFAPTISEANAKDRCVLALSDLETKAWDRNGPLRDCSICRTFAASAIKALLNTPPEDQKCIRKEITRSIAKEAEFCIKKKLPNFSGIPDIPDLEEGSFQAKEAVVDSISDYILINSRLSFCSERKPKRALSTRECLSNPFPGFFQKHCNSVSKCDGQATGECSRKLQESKVATCECINEARQDLKQRISGIADAINDAINNNRGGAPTIGGSGSKVDSCVANIKRQLITPVNDWAATIDHALNTCIRSKPAGQSLGVDSLLNVGCRKVIADTSGTATSQLKTGFDFVNNLIDAMVERSRRFCGGPHCQ